MSPTRLGRRASIAGVGAAFTAWRARATETVRRIQIGPSVLDVPTPFTFGEFVPPGAPPTDTLPPRFSFAFTFPDGAPAGSDLEFPPVTRPFVLERPNNQFLVMCYRVSESGRHKLHTPPRDQLANILVDTSNYEYFTANDSLEFRQNINKDDVEFKYLALIDHKNQSGIEGFLSRIMDAQFFFGAVEFERPGSQRSYTCRRSNELLRETFA